MADVFHVTWDWIYKGLTVTAPDYLVSNIPVIIQALILLVLGYAVGKIVKLMAVKFLGVVGLKRATTRTWTDSLLKAAGYRGSFVELIGDLMKWLIYILFLAIIIQTLGLPGLADIFTQVAAFMPRFIGAILIIVVGLMISDFFGRVFEEAGSKLLADPTMGKVSGTLVKYSVSLVIISMALSLVGIDTSSIIVMLAAFFGIIILMFSLGIKDMIPNFTAGLHVKKTLKPGDSIRFENQLGEVISINSLSTTIRTRTGRMEIPNLVLFQKPVEVFAKK